MWLVNESELILQKAQSRIIHTVHGGWKLHTKKRTRSLWSVTDLVSINAENRVWEVLVLHIAVIMIVSICCSRLGDSITCLSAPGLHLWRKLSAFSEEMHQPLFGIGGHVAYAASISKHTYLQTGSMSSYCYKGSTSEGMPGSKWSIKRKLWSTTMKDVKKEFARFWRVMHMRRTAYHRMMSEEVNMRKMVICMCEIYYHVFVDCMTRLFVLWLPAALTPTIFFLKFSHW
jgi:hypothetical protein